MTSGKMVSGGPSAEEKRAQHKKEARQARLQTKKLHAIQDEIREKDETTDTEAVNNLLTRTAEISAENSKKTKVAILDAQINCDVAKLGLKVVKSQNKLTQQFTQKDFITRIVQNYRKGVDEEDGGSTILDWEKMRVNCARFFDSAPSCHFLASDMSKQVAQKARKVREAQVRRAPVVEAKPTYGNANDKVHKQESEKRKNQLRMCLEGQGGIDMPKLIINPKSFGESVENLFAMGCIVSEGYAGVKSVDGKLVVYPTDNVDGKKRKTDEEIEADKQANKHDGLPRCIIKFDYERFLQATKVCGLTDATFHYDPDGEDVVIEAGEEDMQSAAQTLQQNGSSSQGARGGASKRQKKGK